MEVVAASVIAVLGTLLGAGFTHAFQQRAIARNEEFTRDERLRQARLDAYGTYGGALLNYRRSLVRRWFSENGGHRPEDDPAEARTNASSLRTEAQEALFRVQLVTEDGELTQRAWDVFDEVGELHKATSPADLAARRVLTRDLIRDFISAARSHVRPGGSPAATRRLQP